ncbi:exodeoxyribonuclease III [Robertkochia marina]|uniref:Exodeoxyribonuclease III n=1 Tax=Robertkochia marina TaxID=1227945 RepID=A0A4S3LY21_9FLAO|nr:exodeoxyribonuclease III [Robertkochia marina]THD66468.1 exodeoxyribonuclease III [Robertkochia marina]TRZ44146.1 exodeoxyribonuclease III [Robertkochia marina]
MKIVSWNVNGIRAVVKKDFFDTVKDLNPDVLCIQETKAQVDETEQALSDISDDFNIAANAAEQKGYSGTAILSKNDFLSTSTGVGKEEHDSEGRVICSEFEDFYLVNVYVPNSGQKLVRLDYRETWDNDFLNYLKSLEKKKPVIVCGDMNVAHKAIDLKNDKSNYNKTAGYTQKEIDGMTRFLENGFVDTFRHFHPEEVAYTYWSYRFSARKKNIGWRLDYFLISESLVDKVEKIEILSDIMGSDHCPVALTLTV